MARISVIPADGIVVVDGIALHGIDMSSVDPGIHAVQWYGSSGEVEWKKEPNGALLPNIAIDSVSSFQTVLDLYAEALAEINKPPAPPTARQLLELELSSLYEQLAAIDAKSIRALREGDSVRIAELEASADAIRVRVREIASELV